MTIGKREIIVILAVSAIVTIFLLHMMIFKNAIRNYKEAKELRDAAATEIGAFKQTTQENLDKFKSVTAKNLDQLTSGLAKLNLQQPEVFLIPPMDKVQLEIPADTPPDKVEDAKKAKYAELREQKLDEQVKLVFKEIERLQGFVEETRTRMTFLGAGPTSWDLPTQLPPRMQTEELWDQLNRVAANKETLTNLTNEISQNQFRAQYEMDLFNLGLNVARAKYLAQKGEFVPVIYRLAVANLILKQVSPDRTPMINGEALTPKLLFRLIELDLPSAEMTGAQETKMYFLYEQLRDLNSLLDQAIAAQVKEVTDVVLRAYGFLETQDKLEMAKGDVTIDITKLNDDDRELEVAGVSSAAEVSDTGSGDVSQQDFEKRLQMEAQLAAKGIMMGSPEWNKAFGISGGSTTGATASATEEVKKIDATPKETDIGYAILIRMRYVADNNANWTYLYNILRSNPLVELDRLLIESQSKVFPASLDLEVTPSFIFVPKLFNTQETVQTLEAEMVEKNAAAGVPATGDQPTTAVEAASTAP